ncbi:MFS transporter [Actinomadura spongiicola]|uniref:MFS transporter n=1 Tax=Actinomadura spongiicola TaxID=2303421 RepID=A0A372GN15_9ACTN|nr:MFS transporter [Actinomadura spongiicola]RFS86781.1 MFS transporter [Actinomadura spongiicola]
MAEDGIDPRRWAALALLCTANFMVILDAQIVLLALPSIDHDLGFSGGGAQWVLSAYLLGFGGLMLLGGRAADLLGRRRTFLTGTALFLVASLLCGLAWTGGALIAARVVQGISAALMAPSALSLVTATFEEGPARNKALAIWSSVGGFGATAALLVGGTLTDTLGWPWVFFLNVPVAAVLLALGPALLSESKGTARAYDPLGALTVTLAVSAAVYGIVRVPETGWTGPSTIAALLIAVAAGALFVWIETRSAAPLVPLRIFRSRRLNGGNLAMLVTAVAAFGTSFTVSQYAQGVLDYSPLEFGLATAVLPVMAVVGSYAAQSAIGRVDVRPVATTGLVFMAAGCVALGQITENSTYLTGLLPGLFLFGTGLGTCAVAATVAALSAATDRDSGLASGLNTAAFQLGGALGVAVASTVGSRTGTVDGFRTAFDTAAGIALAGAVIAGLLLATPRRRRVSEPTEVTTLEKERT